MKQGNLDIVFNNGQLRQLLMLPETPLKIIFIFEEKELILREKYGKHGLYVISHQRGFSETDTICEPDQQLKPALHDNVPGNETRSNIENSDVTEWFKESSDVSSKGQALNTADSIKNFNDLQVVNDEICNSVHSSTIKEQDTSLHPLKTGSAVKKLVKTATCGGSQAIFGEIIYSQPTGPTSNATTQDKTMTVQSSLSKQNKPIIYQIELITKQNGTESYTTQSKTHNKIKCNQDVSTLGVETVHNNEISDSDDDDIAMDFGLPCSDISSDDEDNNINESWSSVMKNKLSEIFDNHNKEGTRPPTFSDANKCSKTRRRCIICLRRDVPGELAFSRFPTCPEKSDMWAKVSGRKWLLKTTYLHRQSYFVCSDHFIASDYQGLGSRRLKLNAVPTRNLPKLPAVEQRNAELIGRLKTKLQLALHKPPENIPQTQKKKTNKKSPSKVKSLPQKTSEDITCCVPMCSSSKSKCPDYSFHNFPPEEVYFEVKIHGITVSVYQRQEWIRRFKIKNPVTKKMRVCSRHFVESDFILPTMKFQSPRLKRNAVPTQYLPPVSSGNLNLTVQKSLGLETDRVET